MEKLDVLKRDYLPPDLKREIDAVGITGVVTVQVRQSLAENDWMLKLAEANDWMLGVVGWGPLQHPRVGEMLAPYAERARFKGVRHIVQDEPDDNFLLAPDFNRGIAQLHGLGLVYDILIYERQLTAAIQFVDKHPLQEFVLDHIAKPRIRDGVTDPWTKQIRELAKRENVTCKISGVATEANHKTWTEAQLIPYLETALEAFGPKRLMFGSDWPVALLATGYKTWFEIVARFVSRLSPDEQTAFWSKNAIAAYHLELPKVDR